MARSELANVDPEKLLEQVLRDSPAAKSTELLFDALSSRVEKLREALPTAFKGEAERFIRRAAIYFGSPEREKLRKCSLASVVMCVVQAAELGFAIDGRLAYAVPYKDKAQLQLDYKGCLAVCRRSGTVRDAYARNVSDRDVFDFWHEGGRDQLIHRPNLVDSDGKWIGAYACIVLPTGEVRYEWMTTSEINKIRARSIAFQYDGGPWKTDEGEMRKKTVLKRGLKNYAEDPTIGLLLAAEAGDYEPSLSLPVTSGRRAAALIHGQPVPDLVDEQPPERGDEPRHVEAQQQAVFDPNYEPDARAEDLAGMLREAPNKARAGAVFEMAKGEREKLGSTRFAALEKVHREVAEGLKK